MPYVKHWDLMEQCLYSGSCDIVPELIKPSPAKSQQMRNIRNRDTTPEMAVRRELHSRGLRYRVHMPMSGIAKTRPDIVFTRVKVAVFIDGCFWHCCPDHGTLPKTNPDWWRRKLTKNVTRDRSTEQALRKAGWKVIRIWEHENTIAASDRIETIVRNLCDKTSKHQRGSVEQAPDPCT